MDCHCPDVSSSCPPPQCFINTGHNGYYILHLRILLLLFHVFIYLSMKFRYFLLGITNSENTDKWYLVVVIVRT